jgi:hypothetical protein
MYKKLLVGLLLTTLPLTSIAGQRVVDYVFNQVNSYGESIPPFYFCSDSKKLIIEYEDQEIYLNSNLKRGCTKEENLELKGESIGIVKKSNSLEFSVNHIIFDLLYCSFEENTLGYYDFPIYPDESFSTYIIRKQACLREIEDLEKELRKKEL